MMKTSTPTTKNNSKDDSGSRSSKYNSTNKTPTRKPYIKSCWVTPNIDKVKIVQVPKAFDKNDKDDMLTVSSSSNEQGYFSSSSEDLEPVQQEVQNNVLKSNKNMIAVMKRYILPEHPQENKIIKI